MAINAYKWVFNASIGTSYPGASIGQLTMQLPIMDGKTFDAIWEAGGFDGTGSKVLIYYDTGPSATYYAMANAGWDPSNQMYIWQALPGEPTENEQTLADAWAIFFQCINARLHPALMDENLKMYLTNSGIDGYIELEISGSYNGLTADWHRTDEPVQGLGYWPCQCIKTAPGGNYGICCFYYYVNGGSSHTSVNKQLVRYDCYNRLGALSINAPWVGANKSLTECLFSSKDAYNQVVIDKDDPYNPGENSGTGGFGGNFDNSSDTVVVPDAPTWSAADTGFCQIYSPTFAQAVQLSSVIWTTDIGQTLANLLANPMDVIMSFHALPLNIPKGEIQPIKVGPIETTAQAALAVSQWVTLDCGSIDVQEYWGGFMDYSPYTKISLYLPYCGNYDLDVDEIMGHKLGVKYLIDILTGSCVAMVSVDSSVKYQYQGMCKYDIPTSAPDYRAMAAAAVSLVTGMVTGVAGTPMQHDKEYKYYSRYGKTMLQGGHVTPAKPPNMTGLTMGAAAAGVMMSKPHISHGGAPSGNAGVLGVQYPYLTITRPRQAVASSQGAHVGFPSWITRTVGALEGFTIFEDIHLESLPFTADEIDELNDILKTGAIL